MRVDVFDEQRREWRDFEVVPPDAKFIVRCGNGLHQFEKNARRCACGSITRNRDVSL